jgi:trk system potassium uptake protein TrkA
MRRTCSAPCCQAAGGQEDLPVNRNTYIKLFELVGVDRAISPARSLQTLFWRVIEGEDMITLSGERVGLMDFIAKDGAKIIGKNLSQELPKDAVPGLIMRNGRSVMPDSEFKIEEGDRVFVISMTPSVSK